MEIVYLTRRNLEALLRKLDRKKNGEHTHCTIIKNDTVHPKFPIERATAIVALENDEYYTDRAPGVSMEHL